jgi:ribulose-phosphate 3-epimerase
MPALFPSLISSNILNLEAELTRLSPYCDGFHIDMMDGHFVPNLTWGPVFVNALRKATELPLWVHLMVDKPQRYIRHMLLRKGDIVSLHYETVSQQELQNLLVQLQQQGIITSIALKPSTALTVLAPLFQSTPAPDNVLLMSVEPGASGQSMLPNTGQRLQELTQLQQQSAIQFSISLDGGITTETLEPLRTFHIESIAVASGIFAQENQIAAMQALRV